MLNPFEQFEIFFINQARLGYFDTDFLYTIMQKISPALSDIDI